ncbi:hypothetical protein NEUTE1DRAFT_101801 [Neurospora tetrasperma FGSC 2508]|uniref:Uncharacterized protein n=1 Tax=Neurospora tetrasperma (strain FGSC 2508 / ATCC MYA-4615 / P0657) TaxID=510951 RepID=F8MQ91_NEUT8|nr:uncharacterized protein NEUTE1DRAFT_101801 [Neurospora tetrasperma FGSC 2508]EGO56521.1 hypothetical protein NEUTE1DRAFT_101801 [Neurospora tetrasperma FGSC 2508]
MEKEGKANCQGFGSPFHSIWLPCFGKMRQIFTVFRGLGLVIFAVDSEAGGSPIAPHCTPWRPRLSPSSRLGPRGAQEMDGRESTWPPGTRRRGEMPCIGLACRCG